MTLPELLPPEGDPAPDHAPWQGRFPSISIGVLGCLAALVAFLQINDSQSESDSLRFQRLVERVATRIADITHRYEYGLRGGRGLFAAAGHVTAREWQLYIASHGLESEFPGALGFGVVRRVPRVGLRRFEESVRADGLPEFRVDTAGDAPEVLPITFIEPLERNIYVLGQDIGLRPEARQAAELAMLSGRPALTSPIRNLRDNEQWGFLYFVPCYAKDAPIETEEQRRAALECWIYAPIVMDRLLSGIATQVEYQVDFDIFDETSEDARTSFYDRNGAREAATPVQARDDEPGRHFVAYRTLEIGQRRWRVCVSSLPAFHAGTQGWLGWIVLEGGALAALLLALFVHWLGSQRARAENLVEQRTRELRLQNQSLEAALVRADAATKAKSEFLANMSHEIRSPMTAILGFAQLLHDPHCGPEQRNEYLRTINSNGNHLLSLFDDILDLSKIEACRMAVESRACSPVEIVDDVVERFSQRARTKGIALVVSWPAALPERILTDPARARQVLENLLGNALKFTEQGEVRIESSFEESLGQGSFWICRVQDTGIGMDERQLERVFEPFTQGDGSATRRFGGSGLGLPISRRLTELLGGGLTGEGKPGRGCTFTARFATGPLEGVRRMRSEELRAQRATATQA